MPKKRPSKPAAPKDRPSQKNRPLPPIPESFEEVVDRLVNTPRRTKKGEGAGKEPGKPGR